MRCRSALLLLFLFGFSVCSPGQVPLAVPQIAVGGDAAGENYATLVQIVNNNSLPETVRLTLLADSGSALQALFDGQGPRQTLDLTLAPGEFRQIELTLSGPVTTGWLAGSFSPVDILVSVILRFRSGSRVLSEVGVDPAYSTILAADFAVETDAAINTGIALANPSSATAYVLARLWDPATGTTTSNTTLTLPANGHLARFVTEIFPDVLNIAQARAKVSVDSCSSSACTFGGGNGFVATAIRLNGEQFTTVPVAERTTGGETTRVLPQVAFGGPESGLNMKTVLYLTTNVATGVFGTAEIFDDNGGPLTASVNGGAPAATFPFTVSGNRVTRVVLGGDATLRSGWIKLTLPGPAHLVASAVFQTFTGAALSAEASVLEVLPRRRGLVPLRIQPGSDVGVALANPQTDAVTATLTLFDTGGNVVGVREISLPPSGHLARLATELFPQLAAATVFDGSLALNATGAIAPLALRLSGDKLATLPVAEDGIHRPAVTSLRITRTQRSPAEVGFEIDITDADTDAASGDTPTMRATVALDFGSSGVASGDVELNAAAIVGRTTATLSGTFRPNVTGAVPAGFPAVLYVVVSDSKGNVSNIAGANVRF